MNNAIQSHADAPSASAPSETDSYERASAFLSGWIEESLLVPTAKAAQPPQRHRPLSPPGLDLPLPSSRALRRRITVSNGDNINSLVTSLQTSLMLHEHQNQNRPTHHRLNISPTYVGTVLHKEPSSRRGRAAIIPTLPFCERPQQPSVPSSSNPPGGRDRQRGGVPSVRSVSAAPSQTKRHSRTAPCSSLRSRSSSGGGRRRRNCVDAPLKSQSQFEDVKDKRGSNKHRSKSSKNRAGQVDELAQPNDLGSIPTIHTSSPESSPVPSPEVEKEVIKGAVTDTVEVMKTATATVKEDVHPSRKRGDEKKSSSKPKTKPSRKKSRRHTMATEGNPFATTKPSSLEASLPLDRLSDLDGPNFDLGDTFHSPNHQIIESNPTRAVHLINQLRIHDFAWILRSSNEWTYGIVADFPERGEVPSIRFVIDKEGNTKTFKMKHWAKCIRLVDDKSQSQKQK
eukprot:scaffold9817_cov98-Skeletonema_dohrnii-CCMP3373.AAC.1